MNARDIHNQLCSNVKVTNLYKGNCKGCGECCSRFLPVSFADKLRISQFIKTNNISMRPEQADYDLMCPFLDENKECTIYEVRPQICKSYRCDKHVRGEIDSILFSQHLRIVDVREEFKELTA